MDLKYIKFNKTISLNFYFLSIIIIFGLISYGNQFNRYWSFSDLSQYSFVNLNFKLYDNRNFGGVNFNIFNLLSILESQLNILVNNQQFISFILFSILAYFNYKIFEYNIDFNNRNGINSVIYAINPFTAVSFSNISNNLYQYYSLIPLLFLIVIFVLKNVNKRKILGFVALLSIQFYLIFLHPSFLILTLYILIFSYFLNLILYKNFKNFLTFIFFTILVLSGVIVISVIGLIDPLISKSVNSDTMLNVYTNNTINFWNLISLDRYSNFFRLSNCLIGFISIIIFYNILILKNFVDAKLTKIYLISLIIILLIIVNLYQFNLVRNYLFKYIPLFWPLRTNDKLYIFLPFLILCLSNQIYIREKIKLFITSIKYIIIFLCLVESIYYNKVDVLINESISKYSFSFNSPKLYHLEEMASIINKDPGSTLILSSRSKSELIGWVELPEINLLGKHPFFDLLHTKSIIDDDILYNISNTKISLRNIIKNSKSDVVYTILRLNSFKYIFIDKYSDLSTFKNNQNYLINLIKNKKIFKCYENESGIIYKLFDPLAKEYYISIAPDDILVNNEGKISLSSKKYYVINGDNGNLNKLYYFILNTKYSYYWFNKATNSHSMRSIFDTNIFNTDGQDVDISFISLNNLLSFVR